MTHPPTEEEATHGARGAHIGALVEWYHGIFGRKEDRAVLHGRARVY